MSKAHKHQGIIAKSAPGGWASKSLILQTCRVLARHNSTTPVASATPGPTAGLPVSQSTMRPACNGDVGTASELSWGCISCEAMLSLDTHNKSRRPNPAVWISEMHRRFCQITRYSARHGNVAAGLRTRLDKPQNMRRLVSKAR